MTWRQRPYKQLMKQKSWFFENINKINKLLAKLTKRIIKIKKKFKNNKIRDEKWDIITNTNEIKRITRKYFENLYPNKLENLEELDKFLDAFYSVKLNQEDIKHLNGFITSNEVEGVIVSQQRKA
jgi:hypothetical protein